MMVPELPQHVHALRAELAAGLGRHRPAHLVRDLVGVHRRSCLVTDDRGGQVAASRSSTTAYDRYNEALDEEASKLLLLQEDGAPEKNYYVNEYGRMQVNAPWYGPDYHRMCTDDRLGRPRALLIS